LCGGSGRGTGVNGSRDRGIKVGRERFAACWPKVTKAGIEGFRDLGIKENRARFGVNWPKVRKILFCARPK